jgi:hypothetical protein
VHVSAEGLASIFRVDVSSVGRYGIPSEHLVVSRQYEMRRNVHPPACRRDSDNWPFCCQIIRTEFHQWTKQKVNQKLVKCIFKHRLTCPFYSSLNWNFLTESLVATLVGRTSASGCTSNWDIPYSLTVMTKNAGFIYEASARVSPKRRHAFPWNVGTRFPETSAPIFSKWW